MAQLILDLEERGLLDRTLVVLAISPKTVFEIEKRPFYIAEDSHGRPVRELFA